MDISKKFAVVDLETTGTNKKDNKIIQFGCTLIDNGKITNSISILINPDQDIPERIQNLTSITNEDLINAPSFNEVAAEIFELLKDRVFVAHNVNFDFPFIKQELSLAGFENLNVPAIDTVELSQILLPQLNSFKLQDISNYLNIKHDNPHRADDDSNVTAKLLLILIQRINLLPMKTLSALVKIGKNTTLQTGKLFEEIYENRSNDYYVLPEYLYNKNGIILRKKFQNVTSNSQKLKTYPQTAGDKKKILSDSLAFRTEQAKLMDIIHDNSLKKSIEKKWSIIEAPTGVGKTLGYLFPLAFNINSKQKLVIATTTIVLQEQILDEAIPLLNKLFNYSFKATIMKSSYNYIDLDRFFDTLHQESTGHKITSILKMKILVWLTMTLTGDLNELHLSNQSVPYLSLIRHRGETKQDTNFSDDDFWTSLKNNAKNSEIIITNQAYLSANLNSEVWGENSYLVVDEAHHLSENLRKNNSPSINVKYLNNEIKKISDTLYQNRVFLRNQFTAQYSKKWDHTTLELFEKYFQKYEDSINQLNKHLFDTYFSKRKSDEFNNILLQEHLLNSEIKRQTQLIHMLTAIRDILMKIIIEIDELIGSYFQNNNFSGIKISNIISNLSLYNNNLRNQTLQILDLLVALKAEDSFGIGLKLDSYQNPINAAINWFKLDVKEQIEDINTNFKDIYLIGGSLNSNDNFKFFINDLQLNESSIQTKISLKEQFDVANNTKLFVPTDTLSIKDLSEEEYSLYLSEMITNFLSNNTHQALILFNSLTTMREVFKILSSSPLAENKEILAQGINGNTEKIKKRFLNSNNSILLGSNSFWEGVDFPKKVLEIVIVTRLPFDSPDRDETIIRSKYLSKLNVNAFVEDAIPRATLKLRQGFGRLLRTPEDKGVMIVLDNRLITKTYGQQMLTSFPKSIIETNLNSKEIKQNIDQFLI